MSVQMIEGDLYIGRSGNAITAATGSSGVACGSVVARQVNIQLGHHLATFRRGLAADDFQSFSAPLQQQPIIVVSPRDDTYSDIMAEVLLQAFAAATGGRSDYSGGDAPGKAARTVQLIVRPITGAASLCLYAPAVVLASPFDLLWSRRETHTQRMEVEFRCERSSASATTPALMWNTPATIQAAYFA